MRIMRSKELGATGNLNPLEDVAIICVNAKELLPRVVFSNWLHPVRLTKQKQLRFGMVININKIHLLVFCW